MKKFFAALLALALLTGSCCALADSMRQAADDAIDLYNILLPTLLESVYPERHDDFLPYFQLEYNAAVTEETGIPTYTGSQSLMGTSIYVSFVGEDSENPFSQLMLFCTTDDMELASGMLYPIVVYAGVLLDMDVDEINAIKAWIYASPEEGESITGDRCVVTRMESESMLSFYLTTDGAAPAAETGDFSSKSSEKSSKRKLSSSHTPTTGEQNALDSANRYLSFTAFSRTGLIDQLEYEGYTTQEAEYAADQCGADWMEQARKKAVNYLEVSAFSESGLIEQLEYEGFTHEQAAYGVSLCGANWMEQADKKAASYLSFTSFSRNGLIQQLEYEGFTHEQAVYGAEQNGY